jgi:plastocyanin/heme-degrading monooxygenase HmoA
MEHQPNEHGSHGGAPHLPDPSIWPLVVGVAALFLGAALIFWSRDTGNDFAGPLLGAAIVATLVAVFGWAYEDGRMKRKAEQEQGRDGREARYTQVVTFAIAEGQVETARGKSGILNRIEGADSALRGLDGFQDLRIILSPATTGPSQVLVETTWADREGLATYEQTRQTMLDILANHPEEVVPGSVQVFDMEVVRDTKDVSFRFGAGAAFTVIAGLLVGGFMVGAGLSLFQEEETGGGDGGVAPTPPPENPFRVVATDNKFDKTEIVAGPNAEITITLVNNGAAKHNIHFLDKPGGTTLADGAQGEIIDGGGTETKVTFTTPGVGDYYFLCDLHPDQMNGTFRVVEGGPTGTGETPSGGGGEVPGATQVVAKDNFYDVKTINAQAGVPFTVTLTNEGKALHNIHFQDEKGGTTLVEGAQGKIIKGGETDTITFTVPNPGTYYFLCDIHPTEMFGDFIVE